MLKVRLPKSLKTLKKRVRVYVDERARHTSHGTLFLWRAGLSTLALLCLLGLGVANSFISSDAPVAVHVKAKSQALTLNYLKGDLLPGWSGLFANVENVDGYPGQWCNSGTFAFSERSDRPDKTQVTLTAKDVEVEGFKEWKMIAQLDAMTSKNLESIGEFTCVNDQMLPPTFVITLQLETQDKRGWVSAIPGRLQPGDPAPANAESAESFYRPTAFLQSGSVRTQVKSLPLGTGKIEKFIELSAGDQLKFEQAGPGGVYQTPVAYLTLRRIKELIVLDAQTVAERISVVRYGDPKAQPLELAPPLWERFQAQEEWVLLLAIFLLVQSIFIAWGHYAEQVWPQSRSDKETIA